MQLPSNWGLDAARAGAEPVNTGMLLLVIYSQCFFIVSLQRFYAVALTKYFGMLLLYATMRKTSPETCCKKFTVHCFF